MKLKHICMLLTIALPKVKVKKIKQRCSLAQYYRIRISTYGLASLLVRQALMDAGG